MSYFLTTQTDLAVVTNMAFCCLTLNFTSNLHYHSQYTPNTLLAVVIKETHSNTCIMSPVKRTICDKIAVIMKKYFIEAVFVFFFKLTVYTAHQAGFFWH